MILIKYALALLPMENLIIGKVADSWKDSGAANTRQIAKIG